MSAYILNVLIFSGLLKMDKTMGKTAGRIVERREDKCTQPPKLNIKELKIIDLSLVCIVQG